jgi:hypothetical protein
MEKNRSAQEERSRLEKEENELNKEKERLRSAQIAAMSATAVGASAIVHNVHDESPNDRDISTATYTTSTMDKVKWIA